MPVKAEQFKEDLAEQYRQAGQLFYLGGWVQSELKDIRQEIRDVRLELKGVEIGLRQEMGTNNELLIRKIDGLQRWVIAALLAMLLAVVGLNLAG